jgi:hypothetical protein
MQTLPDYHIDALFRAAMDEEADVLASTAASDSQMHERVSRVLARRRTRRQLGALMLAAALMILTAAAIALGGNRLTPPVTLERTPEASATPETPEASATPEPSLPPMRLPGTPPDEPAGEYGWSGTLGDKAGMHKVVEDGSQSRQTQLTFAIANDCFANGTDAEPVPVTVAGLDGLYVEPYEDRSVLFVARGGETIAAYALAIGDRTLCVYLAWDSATTQDELEAARQVVESIRAQLFGPDGIRINFTLPEGWDTG